MNMLEQGFRLEELCIEPMTGAVSGPGGREQLDPKVMGVLILMAERAGRVVPREELHARLWPNAVVTDDALTRCFYELRRQLTQAGGSERYKAMLETLPKRGYRLNAAVAPLAPSTDGTPARWPKRRWFAAGVAVSVLLLSATWYFADRLFGRDTSASPRFPNSIAVLPFADMSAGQDQQYLSDGIAEEILDRLARAEKLRVIARTSSFSFRNRPVVIPEIAAELNVSHVLEGSVRRSGDRIRITVQLVRGTDASHIWSNTYDRTVGELFALQDEIAAAVAESLQATLEAGSPLGKMPANPQAYESFLQGEHYYNRRAPGDIERAVRYYEQAVAHDPGFAKAWEALAGAYGLMWWDLGQDPAVWRPRQGDAARKAVALDPSLVKAQVRLAQYYFDLSNRRKGMEHLRKAAALDPDDPSLATFATGGLKVWHASLDEEIETELRRAERDPLSAAWRQNLGLLLFAVGRLDEARSEFQKSLELSAGNNWDVELEICRILVAQQRYEEAYAAIMRLRETEVRDYGLALLHRAPNRRAEADAALARLNARSGDHMHGIRVAEAYALRDQSEKAFAALYRTRDRLERDESILTRLWFFQHEILISPFLKPLRSDPRWKSLTAEPTGDTAEEVIEGLWPTERIAESR